MYKEQYGVEHSGRIVSKEAMASAFLSGNDAILVATGVVFQKILFDIVSTAI